MKIDDKIGFEKLQFDFDREATENKYHHLGKLINMNILQVRKYYFSINAKFQEKPHFHILLLNKLLIKKKD